MNLLLSLRSEVLKTKRTAAFYLTLIGAAVVPFIFLLNLFSDGLPDEDKSSKDPLNAIFNLAAEMNGLAIFPMYIILVCTLLPQIEYRNHTWKQVMTSPKTKANILLSKFVNIQLLILLFLVANHAFLWVVCVAAHVMLPDLNVLHRPLDGSTVLVTTVNSYTTLLAVCAIQFWLGIRCRNFIVPVAIGLALWLCGTVLVLEYHSDLANYFPYSFHLFSNLPSLKPGLTAVAWLSAGYAVLFLLLGFFDFQRRRMSA
jgi:lantibiotic transport system permease protein